MALEFIQQNPLGSLILLTFLITLILTLIYKHFSDQKEIKSAKERMNALRDQIKNEKDPEKVMKLQKEQLQESMTHFRHSMKPMMITFLPLILTFWWLRTTYVPFGNLIDYHIEIPLFCFVFRGICDGMGWFLVYVFSSIVFNFGFRKIMRVH